MGGFGQLDLWTSQAQQTHIYWTNRGLIQGINNRFEIIAERGGFWFNTTIPDVPNGFPGRYIFNGLDNEVGRIGANNFWRIGPNASNLDANRRLEIVDPSAPQLRLTSNTTSDVNIDQGTRTDFQTTGVGNLFIIPRNGNAGTNVGINAFNPQAKLHVNGDGQNATAIQISNGSGTGQAVGDGLRMGYAATTATNLEAFINQRENDRLSLYTNNGERMRIMHTGALNNGVAFNPGGLAANFTRIGISHNPATPITRPLSLLHLGYNTEALLGGENGWRPWMDVGMFVSNQSDHVYLGLKPEGGSDRQDAVLSWGDNQINAGASGEGPENFRIIFSSSQNPIAQGTAPATGVDGLEGMRMAPTANFGIWTGIGGDPAANQYFGAGVNPTATLEVNAWGNTNGNSGLRFTDLNSAATPIPNPGQGVLTVDAEGDVIYVPASTAPAIGNYCNAPQQPLQNNFEVPLNGQRYSFTAGNVANNLSSVNIGDVTCATQQPARLYVALDEPMGASNYHLAIGAEIDATSLPPNTPQYAVAGIVRNSHSPNHAGVAGFSANSTHDRAIGVMGSAYDCNQRNIGVQALATGSLGTNIGIESWASGTNSRAGLFMGDVHINGVLTVNGSGFINGLPIITSDAKFKKNVSTVKQAMSIIKQLKPTTYDMDIQNNYGLNFYDKSQYGFIAQDIEMFLPELVASNHKPQEFDTIGKMVYDSVTYKGVNYIGLIPITIAAIQEQQKEIEAKDTAIAKLQSQLNSMQQAIDNLTALVSTCCSSAPQHLNKQGKEEGAVHTNDITLADLDAIILNQNVPNPFSEQTEIAYYLPKYVSKATFAFYNLEGKQINTIDVNQRGNGKLTVFADDLSSGIYSYSLVVDGKIAETKRMTKTK